MFVMDMGERTSRPEISTNFAIRGTFHPQIILRQDKRFHRLVIFCSTSSRPIEIFWHILRFWDRFSGLNRCLMGRILTL